MSENINIKAESIFSKYQPTDIAAMCALKGLSREQATQAAEYWELCERAHGDYRLSKEYKGKDGEDVYTSAAQDSIDEVYALHDKMTYMNWPSSGNAAKGMAYAFGAMLIEALSILALAPEPLSDNLFEQFREADIAYAAALKGWEHETLCEIWRDLVEEQPLLVDSTDASEDLLERYDDLFGTHYWGQDAETDTAQLMRDLLTRLGLIA